MILICFWFWFYIHCKPPGQEDKLLSPSGVIWGRKAGSIPTKKWSSGLPGNWFWWVASVVHRFYYWLKASPKGSSLERFLRYQKKKLGFQNIAFWWLGIEESICWKFWAATRWGLFHRIISWLIIFFNWQLVLESWPHPHFALTRGRDVIWARANWLI